MRNKLLNDKPKIFSIGESESKGDGPIDDMTQGFMSQISRFELTFKQVKNLTCH